MGILCFRMYLDHIIWRFLGMLKDIMHVFVTSLPDYSCVNMAHPANVIFAHKWRYALAHITEGWDFVRITREMW
jgi:hypothetical protein